MQMSQFNFVCVFCFVALTMSQLQAQTLVGDAVQIVPGTYRLTTNAASQIGAVWMDDAVAVNESWEMRAEVNLGGNNGGADGMAFVVRNASSDDLGGNGANMGFGGIDESVGVEMDTYYGTNWPSTGDINSDHLGIQKNGSVSHFGGNSIAGPIAAITGWNNNIENNTYHDLRVTYDATTNEMVVYFNCVQRLVGTVDLEDVLDASEGIWGFTAATGGASNIQRVKNMEWFAWPQGMAEDEVLACPGVAVELTVGSEAVSPTWSPAGGLSSTSGYSVDATVDAAATYTVSYDDICGVEQSESVDLVVIEFPSTELPVDTILCDEGTLTFSNGPWPEGFSGMWEDGSSDLSREIITPGEYSLTLNSSAGCASTDFMTVNALSLPAFDLGEDVSICPGSSAVFDHAGVLNDVNVVWSNATNGSSIEVADAGEVWVTWEQLGCQESDTVSVLLHPIYGVDWAVNPVVLCLNEEQVIQAADANWTGGDVDLVWEDGTVGSDLTVSEPGVYTVTATTPEACTFSSTVNAVNSLNAGVDLGANGILCDEESVTLSSGYNAMQTVWFLNGDLAGQSSSFVTIENEPVNAIVEVTIGACSTYDTVSYSHVPFFDAGLPVSLALCLEDSLYLEALPGAESYAWNNGVSQESQWVNAAGTYVLSTPLLGCVFEQSTEVVPSQNTGVDLGADVVLCENESLDVVSGYAADETQWWLNGDPVLGLSEINVGGEDLTVIVEVVVGVCQSSDTLEVDYAPFFDADIPESISLCNGDSVLVSAAGGAPQYTWSSGEINSSVWITTPGIYTLSTPIQGCAYEASVSVLNIPLPVLNLGPDVQLCEGQQVALNTQLPLADQTQWSTGSLAQELETGDAGTYSVVVTEDGCSSFDTVNVAVQELPVFDLDEDRLLCPNESAFLFVYPMLDGATVAWSTGQTTPDIDVSIPGMYSATTFINGCTWTDTVHVSKAAPLVVSLEALYELCEGEELAVTAVNPVSIFPISYAWSTGQNTPSIALERSGLFEVEVSNVCESVSDEFEIKLIPCGCEAYVPSAFSPDNDGHNDMFRPVIACEPLDYTFEIWNTWGELVFASSDPTMGWIGEVEGDPALSAHSGYFAQDGLYVWRLKVAFDEGEFFTPPLQEYSGTVIVVR